MGDFLIYRKNMIDPYYRHFLFDTSGARYCVFCKQAHNLPPRWAGTFSLPKLETKGFIVIVVVVVLLLLSLLLCQTGDLLVLDINGTNHPDPNACCDHFSFFFFFFIFFLTLTLFSPKNIY